MKKAGQARTMLYVYALAGARVRTDDLRGLYGRTLECVRGPGVYAFVEPVSGRVREAPGAAALRRQHALVAALAARTEALLPARFGTTLAAEELGAALGRHAVDLRRALDRVRGHQQMTLRLFRSPGDPESRAVLPTSGSRSGTEHLQRLRQAHARALPGLDRLEHAVARLVSATSVRSHGAGVLAASVFHLIPAESAAEYRRVIDAAARRSALRVTVSGPWPPYAFGPETLA